MNSGEININKDIREVLWACCKYWQREDVPKKNRSIYYTWVKGPYQERFRKLFHQSKLHQLAKLVFLEPEDTSRGGNRRYYKLVKPEKINKLLEGWSLL